MTGTYIVLMGVQGSGKGTQAEKLVEKLGLPHVTTGGMFRELIARGGELGKKIQPIYDAGNLVPDDLTVQVVRDRLVQPDAAKGVIFDGFPRTRPQAEALDTLLTELNAHVTSVPFFNLDKTVALQRLTSRWQCRNNDQHIYNVLEKPPKKAGICDICGGELFQRADDTPEAVEKRISAFYEKTAPLLDYYRERGLLREINADQPIEKVTADLLAVLK